MSTTGAGRCESRRDGRCSTIQPSLRDLHNHTSLPALKRWAILVHPFGINTSQILVGLGVSPADKPGLLPDTKSLALQAASWLLFLLLGLSTMAAIPSPEKILPDDTLILITAPDFTKLKEAWKKGPQAGFWNDPAMKPFRDKFTSKWNEDLVEPLERELGIKLADYTALLQGQIAFALRQIGSSGGDEEPGLILLVDSRDKSDRLKKNLADLRKKWVDAGKAIRTEKIHDIEFGVFGLSTNDVPKTLQNLFPPSSPVQEEGAENAPPKTAPKSEWVVGQVQSLLVVGNSIKAVEPVVLRLSGGSIPALGELAAYQTDQESHFRDAPLYAWINAKRIMDIFTRQAAEKKENPDAPNPFDISPEKIVSALGLRNLKTFGASYRPSDQGTLLEAYVGSPESSRQGLLKILAGEPKDVNPPPFVPADAVKFRRWRVDGQKTWAALEKMISDISPQWLSGINFLIETANTAAREKDPGFDIRKSLIGNLGDDVITYAKGPRGNSLVNLKSPPSIILLGSPRPEQFALALKSLLGFMTQQAGISPEEREFLGRKIYSVPLRSIGLPIPGGASAMPATLSFAASGGYVGLSTDASVLEEYLRTSETQGKALRETAGLNDAAQKVLNPGSSLFGFENQAETARLWFEMLSKDAGAVTNAAAAATAFVPGASQAMKDWLDFSLLPPFEKISKYFYFTVYGAGATVDGLSFRFFAPVPPALKSPEAGKN